MDFKKSPEGMLRPRAHFSYSSLLQVLYAREPLDRPLLLPRATYFHPLDSRIRTRAALKPTHFCSAPAVILLEQIQLSDPRPFCFPTLLAPLYLTTTDSTLPSYNLLLNNVYSINTYV